MTVRSSAALLVLAVLLPGHSFSAKIQRGTARVGLVNFAERTIALLEPHGCDYPWNFKGTFTDSGYGVLRFDGRSQIEYGEGNPVDSSMLVAAAAIEFECRPLEAGRQGPPLATRINVMSLARDSPEFPNPLGAFPLSELIAAVGEGGYQAVSAGTDSRAGILAWRLAPAYRFDTGDCRIFFEPEHIQCDFAYSAILSHILDRLVNEALEGFHYELRLTSGGVRRSYVDPVRRLRVQYWNSQPLSTITIEACEGGC